YLPGSQNWQWVNIYTRLSQERIIFLNQPLTTGVANSIVSRLLYLDSDDPSKPIYLYINSFGDPVEAGMANMSSGMTSIMSGLAIYDTMQHIKSEMVTICMGQAVGISTMILSSGTKGKRASLPHASIALSQPPNLTQGQATDIQIAAQEVVSKRATVMEIFAQNTGQSVEKLTSDMGRMYYMSPQEAMEYGLVDQVLGKSSAPTGTSSRF
ncbi:ATP-dependent Clp protease proteolytic subunit, partial [Okeania sp. SIO2G5]|uniref:ATP-dependent Clp protease proteolytic subunit n=1 Tax=Okeania sp. SIO2G5 TaxID=2607796 RepID=UPI00257A188A